MRLLTEAVAPAGGDLGSFYGEAAAPPTEQKFKVLYQRTIAEDQRTKMGLDPEVQALVTIPTLEVRRVLGVDVFPQPRGKTVRLFDDYFDISKVVAYEPFEIGGQVMTIGWMLHLRQRADNTAGDTMEEVAPNG